MEKMGSHEVDCFLMQSTSKKGHEMRYHSPAASRQAWIVAAALLLGGFMCQQLWASTMFVYGTIVSVDSEKNTFWIHQEMCNYPDRGEGSSSRYSYGPLVRTPPMFILDGKEATPEEALVVGRSVCFADPVFLISSTCKAPYAEPQGQQIDPRNCVYQIDARWQAVKGYPALVNGEKKSMDGALRLLVDVVDGAVRSGRVVSPRISAKTYHEADFSGLTIADGAISGSVKVQFQRMQTTGQCVEGVYSIDGKVEDNTVKGRFKGRFADQPVSGSIVGQRRSRMSVPASGKCLMRVVSDKLSIYVLFDYIDGTPNTPGQWLHYKGKPVGKVKENSLRITGETIAGTVVGVQGNERIGYKEYKATVNAEWLGQRWALGSALLESEGETVPAQVRCIAVSADSPLQAYTPELSAMYKAFRQRSAQ